MDNMIIYNEAFDIYHCIYRLIAILNHLKNDSVELERLRIWDFYLTFPQEISNIKFGIKPEDRVIKKLFPFKNNPYEKISNTRNVFSKMQPYQLIAIKSLASYGVINKDYLILNKITLINKERLGELVSTYTDMSDREMNIIKIMTSYFFYMPLYGEGGLKNRTNLLEYKYDA